MEHEHESVQSRQHRHPPTNKFTDLSRWRVMLTLRQPLNVLCADITVRVAIRLCACRAARMRSPETVSNHLPPLLSHRTSTNRNVRSLRTGDVLTVPDVHANLNLTQGGLSSIQCGALPSVSVRFVQEHVATFDTVVTCLKLKFCEQFSRALHNL